MPDSLPSVLPSGAAGRASNTTFSWLQIFEGRFLLLFVVAVCWLLFFNELSGEWQVNAQYSYGYVVPLLGAVLFWRRWPDRPVARPGKSPLLPYVVVGLLLLELPFSLVFEANPEWRLLYWVNGFQVVSLALALLYHLGGRSWMRHFAPPLLFMLIAVPWPMVQEQMVIQGLMRFVAALTVLVVGVLGIPAIQHGNLIEVTTGIVGIDEACSGVRSLQSALMLSLFLGEMHRFSHGRRFMLLAFSLLFVVVANVSRTTTLVYTAATQGLARMERIHDTVGNIVMFIVLPCLIGMAYLIKPKEGPAVAQPASQPEARPKDIFPSVPRWVGVSAIIWLVLIQVGTEFWYRSHESKLVSNTTWAFAWPVQDANFHKDAIPQTSLAILRCTDSQSANWVDDGGNNWSVFLLRWSPGRNSEQLAKVHKPEICFPAAGAKLLDDFGRVTLKPNGVSMTFHDQSFSTGAGLIHVFYCLWSDRIAPGEDTTKEEDNNSQAGRIRAVLAGKRNLGQQVLEIVIHGPESNDDAVKVLQQSLPNLIKRT
jgi:exosortase